MCHNPLGQKAGDEYVGFSAQEVQKVIPAAVTKTETGYLQMNNDPVLWAMLNAIKEQQAQIERQEQSDGLKRLICVLKPQAELCKEWK